MKRFFIAVVLSAALLANLGEPPVNKRVAHADTTPATSRQAAHSQATQPAIEPANPAPQPVPQPTPVQPPTVTSDNHEALMALAGINPADYGAADYIITHESSWNVYAQEPHTGAYGLCQSLPATKMASAGSDWQTNPVTQLIWCNSYAQSAYGGWRGAYEHWVTMRWW